MKMRVALGSFLLLIFSTAPLLAQTAPQFGRDPRAVAMLQQSFVAMGGAVPADSVATGTVTTVAGSKTDQGTIRILTRGLDQTSEQITMSDGLRAEVFSRDRAVFNDGSTTKLQSRQWAASAQSALFMLPNIANALANPDVAFAYDGSESLNNVPTHHIRYWNTYASDPESAGLAEFSIINIWIDISSGLPTKVSFERRAAEGIQAVRVEVYYSDYRKVGGFSYPFHIEKSLNGTPFATIVIDGISFNTGLADATFSASQEEL